jgi:hypothetical protein
MRLSRQWIVVLVSMGAWLLLSNHCVLALDDSAMSGSETVGCPMHSTPAKEKPAANIPCCKDLRAVAAQAVKNIATAASELVGVRDYLAGFFIAPPRVTRQLLALETGPPRWLSFAESILQRSILAHAPPALLARR